MSEPYCNKNPYLSRQAAINALPLAEHRLGIKLWEEKCRSKVCRPHIWHHTSTSPLLKLEARQARRQARWEATLAAWENEGGALAP